LRRNIFINFHSSCSSYFAVRIRGFAATASSRVATVALELPPPPSFALGVTRTAVATATVTLIHQTQAPPSSLFASVNKSRSVVLEQLLTLSSFTSVNTNRGVILELLPPSLFTTATVIFSSIGQAMT
jgi:hypothetical protein